MSIQRYLLSSFSDFQISLWMKEKVIQQKCQLIRIVGRYQIARFTILNQRRKIGERGAQTLMVVMV